MGLFPWPCCLYRSHKSLWYRQGLICEWIPLLYSSPPPPVWSPSLYRCLLRSLGRKELWESPQLVLTDQLPKSPCLGQLFGGQVFWKAEATFLSKGFCLWSAMGLAPWASPNVLKSASLLLLLRAYGTTAFIIPLSQNVEQRIESLSLCPHSFLRFYGRSCLIQSWCKRFHRWGTRDRKASSKTRKGFY